MTLPTSLTTRQVTGRWLRGDGTPQVGRVTFVRKAAIQSPGDDTFLTPYRHVEQLDDTGSIDVALPVTDDADWTPTGWVYDITITLDGYTARHTISLPAGAALDLADILPGTDLPDVPDQYVLQAAVGTVGGPAGPLDADGMIPADQLPAGSGGEGVPSGTVTAETAYGQAAAAGAATAYSRGDHTHGTPALPTAAAVGADPSGTATTAVSAHAAAADPHGDRAYADTGLAGKAASAHTHAQADVTGLVTALAGKAATAHEHVEADVTGLTASLAGKAATSHAHAGADITSGTVAFARLPTGTGGTQVAAGDHTHAGDGGGTTSGRLWDGDSYELADQTVYVGPTAPPTPVSGDLWFNTSGGGAVVSGFDLATSLPRDITSSGVAHTPGAWVEYIASTSAIYGLITVTVTSSTSVSGNTRSILLDVGVGGSGSEVPIVADLDIGRTGYGQTYTIPLVVPAGSRVSMRIQARETALTIRAQLALSHTPPYAVYYGGAWQYAGAGSSAAAYGITDAASLPNTLTAAGAINTWSAWTVLSASTPTALRWLLILPSGPQSTNWGASNVDALYDVAAGPDGSEVSVLTAGAIAARYTTVEAAERLPLLVAVSIPAGSRLVARYQAAFLSPTAPTLSLIGVS